MTDKELIEHHNYYVRNYRLSDEKLRCITSYFNNLLNLDMIEIVDEIDKDLLKLLPDENKQDYYKTIIYRTHKLPLCSDDTSQQDYTYYKGKKYYNGTYNFDLTNMLSELNYDLDKELQEELREEIRKSRGESNE